MNRHMDDREDRSSLGFSSVVPTEFDFLSRIGFRLVELSDTFAEYKSGRRVVRVFHGRSSYELGVEIGRFVEIDGETRLQSFSLWDVVAQHPNPLGRALAGTTATTRAQLERFCAELAVLTETVAIGLLTNGDDQFESLSAENAARAQRERALARARLLRERADQAWRRRDYPAVVLAYEEIRQEQPWVDLMPSERGRLHYAEKQWKGRVET